MAEVTMDQANVERSGRDPATVAREIIDANRYMTLATADGDGRPWASPVWYAHQGYTDLYWVSRPEARHSRNLAVRPEVGIVIFDSTVPVGRRRRERAGSPPPVPGQGVGALRP